MPLARDDLAPSAPWTRRAVQVLALETRGLLGLAIEPQARSYLGHPRILLVRLKECRRDGRVPFYSRRWMFATMNVTGADPLFSTQWARGPNSAKASPGWNSCVVPSSW